MGVPTSKLEISERQAGDVTVLTLTGQITLDDGDLKFGKYVDDLVLRQGRRKVLVDMGGVTYIDSAGVGMLAAELKIVRRHNADLRLVHLQGRNHRLLAMMKLMSVFEIFDDEAMALRSFARMA